jgi:vacuolar-type H+-ATPase subunit H
MMNFDPSAAPGQPDDNDEELAGSFFPEPDILDLIDAAVDQITDDQIEERLQRTLRRAGSGQVPGADLTVPADGGRGQDDAIIFELGRILGAELRQIGEIAPAVTREWKLFQPAGDEIRAARDEAERITRAACEESEKTINEAAQILDVANEKYDEALNEAAGIIRDARYQAQQIISRAGREAEQILESAESQAAEITAGAERQAAEAAAYRDPQDIESCSSDAPPGEVWRSIWQLAVPNVPHIDMVLSDLDIEHFQSLAASERATESFGSVFQTMNESALWVAFKKFKVTETQAVEFAGYIFHVPIHQASLLAAGAGHPGPDRAIESGSALRPAEVTDITHITPRRFVSRWTGAHADSPGINWSALAGPGGTMIIVEHMEDHCTLNRAANPPEADAGTPPAVRGRVLAGGRGDGIVTVVDADAASTEVLADGPPIASAGSRAPGW